MFEQIKRLYISGKIDKRGVQNAVKKRWLTEAQAEQILTAGR